MKKQGKNIKNKKSISMSVLVVGAVTSIVLVTMIAVVLIFIMIYKSSIEENALINSEQAVAQATNTITSYTEDMGDLMELLEENVQGTEEEWVEFVESLLSIHSDIVAIITYDDEGSILGCWADGLERKTLISQNLSYVEVLENTTDQLNISKPHVESVFDEEYPWVVTISELLENENSEIIQIGMDIRFSEIASYVDDVGIGQHGYCFIIDDEGNIIYHPQQRLISSGIKDEKTYQFTTMSDGGYIEEDVIYTIKSLDNCDWRVIGISYVDELITTQVKSMITISITILIMVLFSIIGVGILFANVFSKPAKKLQKAMSEFEKTAEKFEYLTVGGTKEIVGLSNSFAHMVIRIQELMEKVRQEEISLRKTELNALQAQINPHFLYNTLDSIAWMCEEERTKEAVEMVNSLAKLFRISISKGHELITIEKELQHARSYLEIQNVRYRNQFTYRIDVDEACVHYMCNKITLQPIIENAIYHGLDRMVDEGEIKITISQTEKDIVMLVEDNGVGMTEEQCKEILHREPGDKAGIGIKNVHDRVQIYFGEHYGLHIESELDEGTKVFIRMPKIEEDPYDSK